MWDKRYSEDGFAYGSEPNDFLREQAATISGKRVLCLAEGEGRNAVWLAEQGFDVTAVDLSLVGLEKASQLAVERGVSINTIHADLAEFVIESNAWDAIVSIFCHVSPSLRKHLHEDVEEGLVKGGVLLLEAYTPQQLEFGTGGPPVSEMMMSLESLKDELPFLKFELGREVERDIFEGSHHFGKGAVVQLIARKV